MSSLIYNNPETIIGFLLSIISIILTAYFFLIGIKYKQLSYMYQTTNVLPKDISIEKLSLKYGKKMLNSISVTDLIIWCNGKEVINHDDIASACPLTIHSPAKILNYKIVFTNGQYNDFKVTQRGHDLLIDFDYIEKNNGIAIKITHTDSNENFSVTCKIKAGRKIKHVNRRKGFFYSVV